AVAEQPGAHTILSAHYTGTFALLGSHFPNRFLRRLGVREVDPDTICNKAGHVALAFAIAHVIRRDGLLDRGLLAGHAIGWEELEPQLESCTPGWGERCRARRPIRSATWTWRAAWRTRSAPGRCCAGTSTSPPQIPTRRGCAGRSPAPTCSRSRSTC